jgi:transposase
MDEPNLRDGLSSRRVRPCAAMSFPSSSGHGSPRSCRTGLIRARQAVLLAPRPILNGILWVLPTGAPWRDIPERYGPWETVFKTFNRWREDGTWARIVTSLLDELDDRGQIDHDLWCIDGSVIRARRAAAGAKKNRQRPPAVGRAKVDASARAV